MSSSYLSVPWPRVRFLSLFHIADRFAAAAPLRSRHPSQRMWHTVRPGRQCESSLGNIRSHRAPPPKKQACCRCGLRPEDVSPASSLHRRASRKCHFVASWSSAFGILHPLQARLPCGLVFSLLKRRGIVLDLGLPLLCRIPSPTRQ